MCITGGGRRVILFLSMHPKVVAELAEVEAVMTDVLRLYMGVLASPLGEILRGKRIGEK